MGVGIDTIIWRRDAVSYGAAAVGSGAGAVLAQWSGGSRVDIGEVEFRRDRVEEGTIG